jgi:hypothetical protein
VETEFANVEHRLERPCLPHVKYRYVQSFQAPPADNVPDYNAGPGHVFTTTEQIVNLPQVREHSLSQPLHLPKEQIDSLLNSSLQLNLAMEVTPVQIWSKLSFLSSQFPLGPGILHALKVEALKYIRCNRSVLVPMSRNV